MESDRLTAEELTNLIQRVFEPTQNERSLAIIVDVPDDEIPDNERWRIRRSIAVGWFQELTASRESHGLDVSLCVYRNVHSNNADLPANGWMWTGNQIPDHAAELSGQPEEPMESILGRHSLVLAPTEFSTTAPLKVMAPRLGCRAATMPGFSRAMIPALRLDYIEVNRRVTLLKDLLDESVGADFLFTVDGSQTYELHLDLRHRTGHASGGLLHQPGTAGNLPSGEAYIVPYEGEFDDDPTTSNGTMPVQFGDEVVLFSIVENRAVEVLSSGPESDAEGQRLAAEPARGNLAELGLGVLSEFGITPIGEVLLDEKLGLHLAFGRSEHFGGQVGPSSFTRPEAVMHQDHVYLEEIQPRIAASRVTLTLADESSQDLIIDGAYVIDFEK